MGAWIETSDQTKANIAGKSHPMWVRGLKLNINKRTEVAENVAPYVGAWIETFACAVADLPIHVAPYVGAWIETTEH